MGRKYGSKNQYHYSGKHNSTTRVPNKKYSFRPVGRPRLWKNMTKWQRFITIAVSIIAVAFVIILLNLTFSGGSSNNNEDQNKIISSDSSSRKKKKSRSYSSKENTNRTDNSDINKSKEDNNLKSENKESDNTNLRSNEGEENNSKSDSEKRQSQIDELKDATDATAQDRADRSVVVKASQSSSDKPYTQDTQDGGSLTYGEVRPRSTQPYQNSQSDQPTY